MRNFLLIPKVKAIIQILPLIILLGLLINPTSFIAALILGTSLIISIFNNIFYAMEENEDEEI